jgi:hypothetical protein
MVINKSIIILHLINYILLGLTPSTPKLLTTQKLKSKFKKSTFQFLKSKPPVVVVSTSASKLNSNSINNLFNNNQINDPQRRRLSDYHRPSKVSLLYCFPPKIDNSFE